MAKYRITISRIDKSKEMEKTWQMVYSDVIFQKMMDEGKTVKNHYGNYQPAQNQYIENEVTKSVDKEVFSQTIDTEEQLGDNMFDITEVIKAINNID